jgi:hypothetical protein
MQKPCAGIPDEQELPRHIILDMLQVKNKIPTHTTPRHAADSLGCNFNFILIRSTQGGKYETAAGGVVTIGGRSG